MQLVLLHFSASKKRREEQKIPIKSTQIICSSIKRLDSLKLSKIASETLQHSALHILPSGSALQAQEALK